MRILIVSIYCFSALALMSCHPSDDDKPNPSDFISYDVIINEFMVKQKSAMADPDFNEYSSWIELYNREETNIDIGGWTLTSSENSMEYIFPDETEIQAGGYLLVWTDARDEVGEAIHANFILPEGGGFIGLYGPEWSGYQTIDTLTYFGYEVTSDISWGRINPREWNHPGFLVPFNNPTPGRANEPEHLQIVLEHELNNISDPSGLAFDHSGNYLWVVSDDKDGSIYKITLEGHIVDELEVKGHDMEGIVQDYDDLTLWVAEEREREIVQYDTTGKELQRIGIDVEERNENDGLEGITINPANGHFFIVNEKHPRVLIELDISRPEGQQQVQYIPINFRGDEDARGLDLSGLYFEPGDDILWMVSDEAQAVFKMDQKGRPLAVYHTGFNKMEGIAVSKDEGLIYLVNDERDMLFVYQYPDGRDIR